MDARALLAWGDLDARRRRAAARGPGALSPWVYSVIAGLILGFLIARAMRVFGATVAGESDPADAANLWLAALATGHIIVLLGAPFRMYWRHDSALLGRLAIPGKPLFTVACIRSLRAAAKLSLPFGASALVFALGPFGSLDIALRHLALVVVAFVWAGCFGPTVALAAGAIVASDRARAALASLTGEFQPPRTSWLGLLPGLAGTAMALLLFACVSWTRGASTTPVGEPLLVIALDVLVPLACWYWALQRAGAVMISALREVSALDQERLAHIELTRPSALERLSSRLFLRARGARLLFEKDASLSRRRYPIPYFIGVVGVISAWIAAALAPADLLLWAGIISACLGVYGVVMARRAMFPPIEHPTFLGTLPIANRDVARAKRLHLGLWIAVYMILGAIPVIARSPAPATTAALLGGIMLATWIAGLAVTQRG